MVTLLDKIKHKLEENFLGIGDVRVFANPTPNDTLSGTYRELLNPLPQLLNSQERYEVIFIRGFNTVDWRRIAYASDVLALGSNDWVVWAKDSVLCSSCHQPMPRKGKGTSNA